MMMSRFLQLFVCVCVCFLRSMWLLNKLHLCVCCSPSMLQALFVEFLLYAVSDGRSRPTRDPTLTSNRPARCCWVLF